MSRAYAAGAPASIGEKQSRRMKMNGPLDEPTGVRVTVESLKEGRSGASRGCQGEKHVPRWWRSGGGQQGRLDVSPMADQEIGPPFAVLSRVKL